MTVREIHIGPHVASRYNIHDHCTLYALGRIERCDIRDASAAVMTDEDQGATLAEMSGCDRKDVGSPSGL